MSPEEHILQLEKRIQDLEYKLNQVLRPDRYQFDRTIAHNGDKLGFYGTTPVAQPGTTGITAGHYLNGGINIQDLDDFDGYGTGKTRYTIQSLVYNLKQTGIIKL